MASIQDERGYNQGYVDSPAWRARTKRRADWIAKEIPTGSKVLEIGCGTGTLASHLAIATEASILAIDLSPAFIDIARQTHAQPNLEFRVADFAQAELSEKFDCVVGDGILHHLVDNLESQLNKIRGLLRPRGKIVFLEPNLRNPYVFLIFKNARLRRAARLEPTEMAFTPSWITQQMRDANFVDIHAEHRDFLLPNTPTSWIGPVSRTSDWLEKIPLLRAWSQSIFIRAWKPA